MCICNFSVPEKFEIQYSRLALGCGLLIMFVVAMLEAFLPWKTDLPIQVCNIIVFNYIENLKTQCGRFDLPCIKDGHRPWLPIGAWPGAPYKGCDTMLAAIWSSVFIEEGSYNDKETKVLSVLCSHRLLISTWTQDINRMLHLIVTNNNKM